MSEDYAALLKRRAMGFLEAAKADFARGDYGLTLFHVEQFLQLCFKYLLYRKIGDYPKTYSLIRLIRDVVKVYGDERLREFYEGNLEALYLLEEAYIASRYLPRQYDSEIAGRMLKFAERALEVVRWLEGL